MLACVALIGYPSRSLLRNLRSAEIRFQTGIRAIDLSPSMAHVTLTPLGSYASLALVFKFRIIRLPTVNEFRDNQLAKDSAACGA
jgi:hypothetical protein